MTRIRVAGIRKAGPEDAATIARHRYPGESGEHLAVYADWVPGVMSEGRYLGWLAVRGGRVIGGAGLLLYWQPSREGPNPVRGRVVNVFVEAEFRRQGVARELLQALLTEARSRRLGVLNLGSSLEGRNLYASLGFQASETEMTMRLG
ncbi:GNAT family N-acetyltransferase [Deinococcus sp.]|uniref:GNAT family N-acetyltransferase n=1 Tax=Deinococcus sp. TaxID=47478 RepID=UPI00286E565E|nr:GNAT family N-acetyltransferase [Deinococcus sp.]